MTPPPLSSMPRATPLAELEPILTQISFLREEAQEVRLHLAELAVCRSYPKGNLLFYQGDPADGIYIVISGRVKLCLMNEDGREVILAAFRRGGVFGLVETLDSGPRPGTAATLSDCRLAKVGADSFLAWTRRHPAIHARFVVGLARTVRDAYEKIGELALLTVKRRLLSTLLEIARSDGHPRGEEVVLTLPTHQELAERVGSSRVVISRALRELIEEEVLLQVQGRIIRLPLSTLVLRNDF
jgi:CRP/FNR family transcriptional regulator, cyclic AMP receptor protein